METLACALAVNYSLLELNLSGNDVREPGVKALSVALRENPTLQRLDLSCTSIFRGAGSGSVAGLLREPERAWAAAALGGRERLSVEEEEVADAMRGIEELQVRAARA